MGGEGRDGGMVEVIRPVPADALVAIDIGNTRIGVAVWDGEGLRDTQRVGADATDELAERVRAAWDQIRDVARPAIAIGSVAPQRTRLVQDLAEGICGVEPLRVRDDLPLPMPLKIDNADEVGVDRVCAAAAAFDHLNGPCTIASFGTAITIDCVSADGEFLGGTILPGLEMSFRALHEFTAQLPLVEVAEPGSAFGRNTHDAIRSGVVYGAMGAVREIVERFATELNIWPPLVLTGGNAGLVAPLMEFADAVVPDLCLMGIALSYRRAAGQP